MKVKILTNAFTAPSGYYWEKTFAIYIIYIFFYDLYCKRIENRMKFAQDEEPVILILFN